MQLTKAIEKEVLQVYDTWLYSYLNGDVATYDSYFDDDYHFIGSTSNEEFLSRRDTTKFFENTADQLAGKCDLRKETRILEQFGELVFITHVFDAWFLSGTDYSYYGRFRFSNILRKNNTGWRFIYQHFSTPDTNTAEGETIGFEKISAENQELREAIKRRTFELEQKNRELEIDTALERIRAQVSGMEKPEDLLDIVVAMRKEFVRLGHEAHYFWHMRWHPEKYEKAMTSGDGTRIGMVMELPRRIHGEIPKLAEWEKSDEPTIIFPMDVTATLDYVHKMGAWGDFQHIDPNMPSDDDIRHIGGLTYVMARTSLGEIGYSLPGMVENIPQAELDILIRFARAFDLAHKRFEDLKTREHQHREAQVDLALEKVRSRTMAMKHSDELPEAANQLFLEIQGLGVPVASAGYCIWEAEDKKSATAFVSSIGELQKPFSLPTKGVGYNFYDPMLRGEKFHVEEMKSQEESVKHYEFMRTLPVFGEILDELFAAGFQVPEYQVFHIVYFSKGYLMFITRESVPQAHDIFKRCASVFEQTYTRFLDLQKAEAQAKEKEIELALEKVRSRTMAMQHSDELPEAANLLFLEVQKLGIPTWSAGYNILSDDRASSTCIMSSEGELQKPFKLPLTEHESLRPWHQAIINKVDFFVYAQEGSELVEHYDYMKALPELKSTFEQFDQAGLDLPTCQFNHLVRFSQGFLLFITYEAVPAAHDIFIRFGKVFEQTYTRFLDLQRAEAQAREAQIEASLERVRSRAVAMRHSEELSEAAEVLYNEFLKLGLESFSCGYLINDNENKQWKVWLTDPGNAFFKDFWTIPFDADLHLKARYESWKRKEEFHRDILEGEANRAHHIVIAKYAPWKAEVLDDLPHQLVLNSAHFSLGHLFVISPDPLSPEMEQAMVRFAGVFDLAYRRFLDLQIAEEQAQKIREERDRLEKALHDLQATQKQLIHSEKMASLGELTAGIAHEIQNPLNFVNNFSEVSNELVDEMNEEIDNDNMEEVKAIASDIKQNLEKIHHHGQRADAIVKGMLQHSRKSSGEKTATDINKLADEYLRLAYHGLRAKDKSFNATLNTDFDPAMEKIMVIPQDIGRVVLNLFTNAFYAVNEKKKNSANGYQPTVTISTKQFTDHVTIVVKDNGNGIPQPVLDKIFQPFFTTKPTGQGTGLGLSLSYDIVKAHGGKITINSQENVKTEFTIFLPINPQ